MNPQFPKRGFEQREYVNRVKKAQKVLLNRNLQGLLISSEADIRYFTGFMTQFWQSPTRPWFVIILPEGAPIAIIPTIGIPLMETCYVDKIHSWSSPDKDDDGLGLLLKVLQNAFGHKRGNLGLLMGRETSFRAPLLDILKLLAPETKIQISDITSEIQHIRMIKSEAEIEKLKFICGLVSQVFEDLPNWRLEGIPLSELFRKFKINTLRLGADDVSYLVGASGKGGYFDIIAPPTERQLKRGDIFMLDTGSIWDGYFSDFDRNFALGHASDEAIEAHEKLIKATNAAVGAIKPGVTRSKDLFNIMSSVLHPEINPSDLSINDVGRLGHGLGSQLTEPPSHTAWDETIIEPGMTITIEPSIIYGKEKYLMVAEENIHIKETTIDYLSKPCSKELTIIG
ncbi:MAG: Xaa-Pro peptidase family protein [Paracoccaceae bacterium]|nr:Xaa-Pro peptidase family protein [Paracoccaceae bacterium]